MNALVVGATGGIGRAAVKYLLENKIHTRVFVRNKQKAEKYFSEYNNIEIYAGDASYPADLSKAADGCDFLFYCLNIPYQEWKHKAIPLLKSSLDVALELNIRFVFPGNVYVYGHAQKNPVDEKHPLEPHTSKGKIRRQMEMLIKNYSEEKGLKYTITRFPDFYGPYVVNGFSEKIYINSLLGKKMLWIGDKKIPLEYIFIEDAGRCLVESGISDKGINQEFNVPACGTISNKDYLESISRLGGNNSKYQILNSDIIFSVLALISPVIREVKEMLYLKREELYLDGTKFKNTFGFLPSTNYEEGIKKTFDWVKKFYGL